MKNNLLILLLVSVTGVPAFAGVLTFKGIEEKFWEDRAIIVGQIESVDEAVTFEGTIKIAVKAVVTTDFLVPDRLVISYKRETLSPLSIGKFEPKQNDMFIFCVRKKGGVWSLESIFLTFFESGCAAERISDLKDAKLHRLIEKLAQVRSEYHAKSTQPIK